ncbi:MAG: hypothetical protein NZL83_04010 [Candidatus Absconditabacterales bacterium]|nr:hypothetical protein [Candidatus Absconditabacterales bacterium]
MNIGVHSFDSTEHESLYESLPSTHIIVDEQTADGKQSWITAGGRADTLLTLFPGFIVVVILRHRSLHDINWDNADLTRLIVWDLSAGCDHVHQKHSHGPYPFPPFGSSLCPNSWTQWQHYQRVPSTYIWLPKTDPIPDNTMRHLDAFHQTTQKPTDHPLITLICPPSLVTHFAPLIQWGKEGGISISILSSSNLLPTILSEPTIDALYASGRIWLCCDWMYATERFTHREALISGLGFSYSVIHPQRDAIRSFDFWEAYHEIYNHDRLIAEIANHDTRQQALEREQSSNDDER